MPPRRDCPEDHKWCPDCGREGAGCRPVGEFYVSDKRGLSDYCKRHAALRATAARRKALDNPDPNNPIRLRKRAEVARYRERHKEQRNRAVNEWKRRHPERVAAWYRRWVEQNPDKRRQSIRAYRMRQQQRSAPGGPQAPADVLRELQARDRDLRSDD